MPSPRAGPVIEPPALARLAHRGTEVTVGELREALGVTLAGLAVRAGVDEADAARAGKYGTIAGTGYVTACLRALGFTPRPFTDGSGRIRAVRGPAAFTVR